MRALKHILLALTAVFAASCTGDGPEEVIPAIADIALVKDIDRDGMTLIVAGNDGKGQALHSPTVLQSEENIVGNCIYIAYTYYGTGEIELISASPINNFTAFVDTPDNIEGWDDDPIRLQSCWTIEQSLVVRAELPYYKGSRKLALVIDESSIGEEYPDAYLYHSLEGAIDITDTFYRSYYFAFSIAEVAGEYSINGLNVHINDTLNSIVTIDF